MAKHFATDLLQVLKGATLVGKEIVSISRPDLEHKLERAAYHGSELIKCLKEFTEDSRRANNVQDAEAEQDLRDSNSKYREKDIIGFSNIESSDVTFVPNDWNKPNMRERSVPSSQLSRMLGFSSLAFRMAAGSAVDNMTKLVSGDKPDSSMSDENAERLAEALCRMRGAALKLGQMLSIQDDGILPPALSKALDRVRQNADYMPKRQLEYQLTSQLGKDWRSKLHSFEEIPIAAASIGQVHRAKLLDGTEVAMKVQYPGVAESIASDLSNLKRLVTMTNLLPAGNCSSLLFHTM